MKLMVGYYGHDPQGALEAAVIQQARALDAQVFLVTSMEIGESVPKEAFDRAERNLAQGKTFFESKGIACETVLLETGLSPGEDLIQFAREEEMDQIIIGVRRRSKLGKLIFGSNSQYVIMNAPCPVHCVNEEIEADPES